MPEDEGQHLQSVYQPARLYGGPGLFGFHPDAHLTELSPLATEANRRRLLGAWLPYWRPDARVYIEKSPPNIIRTRFFQALFPEAFFLVVVRHPVAVAGATKRWARTSWTSLIHHWVRCQEIFLSDSSQLARAKVIRYERFVDAPDACLAQVYRWLGLPAHQSAERIDRDINHRYFEKWSELRALQKLDRRIAIARYEPPVRPWGYSLRDLDFLGRLEAVSSEEIGAL